MKTEIKIAVADDHAIFRKGFIALLEKLGFSNIVFDAANGIEVFENLKSKPADLLFLDIEMPRMNGLETLKRIKIQYPKIDVIILSAFHSDSLVASFVAKGCHAFLSKNCDPDILIKTIETVCKTDFSSDEKITSLLPKISASKSQRQISHHQSHRDNNITERECNIIIMLCNNLSNKEIADKLNISIRTVENHREHIKKKTGCRTLLDIVKYAKINDIAAPEWS